MKRQIITCEINVDFEFDYLNDTIFQIQATKIKNIYLIFSTLDEFEFLKKLSETISDLVYNSGNEYCFKIIKVEEWK